MGTTTEKPTEIKMKFEHCRFRSKAAIKNVFYCEYKGTHIHPVVCIGCEIPTSKVVEREEREKLEEQEEADLNRSKQEYEEQEEEKREMVKESISPSNQDPLTKIFAKPTLPIKRKKKKKAPPTINKKNTLFGFFEDQT